MCGIAGTTSTDSSEIRSMIDALRHRGPDASGTFTGERFALAGCRLKVLDLSDHGNQPMTNEDRSVWVVYNGEISNFRELRGTLEAAHHTFVSSSDTEVIVHGYEEWGPDVARHLDGMWAFAIYDQPRQWVVLSRDRTGIKPLYYLSDGVSFKFGSELKAFFQGDARPTLDPAGLSELLTFGFNPSRSTALQSVKKLLRGETLIYHLRERSFTLQTYWNGITHGGSALDLDQLEKLLQTAVERNLISDVPVGCYVSGGIDSSLVSILYSRLYPGTLETFTVGFGAGKDETLYGAQIAEFLGARHHAVNVSDHIAATSFQSIVPTFDLSVTDPAILPLTLLAAEAKKTVTVVLAGEGGDEVFGGYDYYRVLEALRRYGIVRVAQALPYRVDGGGIGNRRLSSWAKLWGAAQSVSPAMMALQFYSSMPLSTARRVVPRLDVDRTVRAMEAEVDCTTMAASPNQFLLMDQSWRLPESLNYKADKASSSVGLEGRVPLQDRLLVEYANQLDVREKVGLRVGKIPLRKILEREVPDLATRPKQGFGSPVRRWVRGEMSTAVEESLKRMTHEGHVDGTRARPIFERSRSGPITDGEIRFLWRVLVVDHCLRSFGY
ncbi:MAG: asparagine synthase (glutamine-hydrolyzing) [Thermoplasmata archaeon]